MKHIKTITDKEILGTNQRSSAKPRRTARAILVNDLDMIAMIYTDEYGIYTLPGGGIEEGENVKDALYREISEETGCNIIKTQELGFIEENRGYCNYTQISYYFIVTTDSREFNPHFTKTEERYGATLGWYSLDEVYENLTSNLKNPSSQLTETQKNQIRFLQARDIAAFLQYLKIRNG